MIYKRLHLSIPISFNIDWVKKQYQWKQSNDNQLFQTSNHNSDIAKNDYGKKKKDRTNQWKGAGFQAGKEGGQQGWSVRQLGK